MDATASKTVEPSGTNLRQPDGVSTTTTYTNYLGETLLTDVYDGSTQVDTCNYYHYDNNGREAGQRSSN